MSYFKEYLFSFPDRWFEGKVQDLKNIKWMNKRAPPKVAYVPTEVEHIANVITHIIWIPCSLYGMFVLLTKSQSPLHYLAAFIYGLSLVLCFTVSSCFHCVHYSGHTRLKEILHRGDRAAIYIFIAGSHFPWLVLSPSSEISHLSWFIWVMAFCGIVYQQMFHEKYRTLETCIYMVVALGPCLIVFSTNTAESCEKIIIGGLVYFIGVFFFKSDGQIPFAHAIWHLFVAAAASIHYFAILHHLF